MNEILSLILIGFSLSLDAFSLALLYGTNNYQKSKGFLLSIIVGIFHFIMPILGVGIGTIIFNAFNINPNILIGLILLFLAISMLKDINSINKVKFSTSFISMFLFAFSVSFDSFSTGIGLYAITNNVILASIIFSIFSFSFTYMGLIIGKYAENHLGKIAQIIGIIILIIISITYLCK